MNTKRIDKLIESLKGLDDRHFDMTRWVGREGCGTVACMAGWLAVRELGSERAELMRGVEVKEWAATSLGLDHEQSSRLFVGVGLGERPVNLAAVKRHHAIKVLEILRDEGVVDWPRAMGEV